MVLTSFDESNHTLSKPEDMTHEQCDPASVLITETSDGIPVVVTCWKCTQAELDEINRTGRVWLALAGRTMSPAMLSGAKFDFIK